VGRDGPVTSRRCGLATDPDTALAGAPIDMDVAAAAEGSPKCVSLHFSASA